MICVMEDKIHLTMQKLCEKILDFDGVRFVGSIDKMGNIVSERFRDGIVPFENEAKRRMFYMQMVLEISMRREFDSDLGGVNYTASSRNKALIITVPIDDKIILVSSSPYASTEEIVKKINEVFRLSIGGNY